MFDIDLKTSLTSVDAAAKVRPWLKENNRKRTWYLCSTMWMGCQSRRLICLFWRETRQRIFGPEISPYPEVGRGREREELTGDPAESSWRWTAERRAERVGVEPRTGAVNTV